MSRSISEIVFKLIADSTGMTQGMSDAKKSMDDTESRMSKFQGNMRKLGTGMMDVGKKAFLGVTTPILGVGLGMLKAASDAEEMRGMFSVVFADLENEMREFAAESSRAWGRSQIDIEGYLAGTQNMLVGMGMTRDEGAELSKQIVQMGVDLASFNNLTESDALRNLQSAISGNHTAAQSLGAVLNENTLAVAMERMELQGKFQDLSEAEKMQVRYTAIMMQSDDAMGDAVRTSGSFANQMRRLWGNIKDTSAELGAVFLPLATKGLGILNKFTSYVSDLSEEQQKWLVIIAAIVAAVPALIFLLGALSFAIGAISLPVVLVVAALAGLIAIGIKVWKNWDTLKQKAIDVFGHFQPLVDTVKGAFLDFWNSLFPIWESLKSLFESLKPILLMIGAVIGGVVVATLGIFISTLSATVSAIGPVINAVINLGEMFVNIFKAILSLLIGDFSGALEYWNKATENAIAFFVNLWEGVVNFFKKFVETIVDFFRGLYMTLVGNSIIPDMVRAIIEWFLNLGTKAREIISAMVAAVISFFTNLLNRGSGIFSSLVSSLKNSFSNILSNAKNSFNSIRDAIFKPIEFARDKVRSAVDSVKGFFSGLGDKLKFNIPKPKLPKFSLKGGFSLAPPSVPSVDIDWYKDGGIFPANSPRLIGIGDAKVPEAALPLTDNVLGTIGAAIASLMPQKEAGDNANQRSEVHLHIGTFVGDDHGLRKFARLLRKFFADEDDRLGVDENE